MAFELQENQKQHLEALMWFLSPTAIGEGRTTLMVYAAIAAAVKNPGKSVYLTDHFASRGNPPKSLHVVVRSVLESMSEITDEERKRFHIDISSIVYVP